MKGEESINYVKQNRIGIRYDNQDQFRTICRVMKLDLGPDPFVIPGVIAYMSDAVQVRIPVQWHASIIIQAAHVVLPVIHPFWDGKNYTIIDFDDFFFLLNPLNENIFQ